jgi:stress response protein YsnF
MSKPTVLPERAGRSGDGSAPVSEKALPVQEHGAEETLLLAEEEVHVGKREVTTGKVRVRTLVDVVTEPVRASLQEETVEVTRVPIDREISEAPQVRTENGVTIVPVVEEVLVVEKRLVLKEELHIRRQTHTEDVEVPVEVRKQRVEVERVPVNATRADSGRTKK